MHAMHISDAGEALEKILKYPTPVSKLELKGEVPKFIDDLILTGTKKRLIVQKWLITDIN